MRVIPANLELVDVQISGKIIESTGAKAMRRPAGVRVEDVARTAGVVGCGAILSGPQKCSDAKTHAQALKELSESFQNEVAPQVVDMEGRTLRLTGPAEEQYREWRKVLHQMYVDEGGITTEAAAVAKPVLQPL